MFLNLSKDDEFVDVYKTGDSSIQFLNFANDLNVNLYILGKNR